ncbi:MAG: hypothetical protein SGJ13_10075 [Actinomycetota bacterium]|nr:hypothetical protein [Actinomycetota bacterium]
MAQNPDPQISLTSLAGVTRTLDDWATVFNLAIVMLPGRREASGFVPVINRIFATFGDSDVRTTVCVAAPASIAERILGDHADEWLVFCDPDAVLATSLGLERLPAFVHLRQDTTLVTATQGWSPKEWQRVAGEIAKSQNWTTPIVAGRNDPPPTPGWPVAS